MPIYPFNSLHKLNLAISSLGLIVVSLFIADNMKSTVLRHHIMLPNYFHSFVLENAPIFTYNEKASVNQENGFKENGTSLKRNEVISETSCMYESCLDKFNANLKSGTLTPDLDDIQKFHPEKFLKSIGDTKNTADLASGKTCFDEKTISNDDNFWLGCFDKYINTFSSPTEVLKVETKGKNTWATESMVIYLSKWITDKTNEVSALVEQCLGENSLVPQMSNLRRALCTFLRVELLLLKMQGFHNTFETDAELSLSKAALQIFQITKELANKFEASKRKLVTKNLEEMKVEKDEQLNELIQSIWKDDLNSDLKILEDKINSLHYDNVDLSIGKLQSSSSTGQSSQTWTNSHHSDKYGNYLEKALSPPELEECLSDDFLYAKKDKEPEVTEHFYSAIKCPLRSRTDSGICLRSDDEETLLDSPNKNSDCGEETLLDSPNKNSDCGEETLLDSPNKNSDCGEETLLASPNQNSDCEETLLDSPHQNSDWEETLLDSPHQNSDCEKTLLDSPLHYWILPTRFCEEMLLDSPNQNSDFYEDSDFSDFEIDISPKSSKSWYSDSMKKCDLCNQVVLNKLFLPQARRFGLLLNCSHSFCYSCIREQCKSPRLSTTPVTCPECSTVSPGIVASRRFIEDLHEKTALFEEYKKSSNSFHDKQQVFFKTFN